MQTYYHTLLGYAIARRSPHVLWVVLGATWPDVLDLASWGWLKLQGLPAFPQAFTLPWVRAADAVTHSAVVWVVTAVLTRRHPAARAFLFGWFTHIAADIVTHKTLAMPYLWPLLSTPIPGPADWFDPVVSQFLAIAAIGVVLWLIAERFWKVRIRAR